MSKDLNHRLLILSSLQLAMSSAWQFRTPLFARETPFSMFYSRYPLSHRGLSKSNLDFDTEIRSI